MNDPADLTNYDDISNVYIELVDRKLSWNNLYERPYMLSVFDDFKGKNVLDAGCGSGFYSLYALKQKASVTAVDLSESMLDYVKKKDKKKRIKFYQADLSRGLPFIEPESQDYIISALFLHYIENWDTLVKDFYRVLKPGGKLYISTHHPFSDYNYFKKENYFKKYFVEDVWGKTLKPFKVHFYIRPLTDILKPFLDADFVIRNIEEPLPPLKCKKTAPDVYKKLSEEPAFIFLTMEKM